VSQARQAVAAAKRIVVKVGSSSLTTAVGGLDPSRLDALVDALAVRSRAGSQVVLVSSGAIAAGLAPLGIGKRPKDLATQQAAASVGQLELVHAYATSFARYQLTVGQLLLTADDVVRRSHYRNAQRTFSRLLALGVVPVVNENDTVATDEIRFGDNDRLAALVAHLIGADALVLLSDVDALYDGDPRRGGARRITEVVDESDLADVIAGSAGASGVGTGGMASKVDAARLASVVEEFLNAGVIVYCAKQNFLRALIHLDHARLRCFCTEIDPNEVQANLDALQRISIGDSNAGPIALLDIASRFRWLTATRSTVVQSSKVHPGFCDDAGEKLQQLFEQLVL